MIYQTPAWKLCKKNKNYTRLLYKTSAVNSKEI